MTENAGAKELAGEIICQRDYEDAGRIVQRGEASLILRIKPVTDPRLG